MFAVIGFFALQNKIPAIVMIDAFAFQKQTLPMFCTTKPDTFSVLWKILLLFSFLYWCSVSQFSNNTILIYIYVLWNLIPQTAFSQTHHLVYQYLFFVRNRRSCIYRGSENSTKSRTCGTSRGSTSRSYVSSDWTSSWPGSRSSLTSWRRCTRWLRWAGMQSWSWSTPSTRSLRASCSGKAVKLYTVY